MKIDSSYFEDTRASLLTHTAMFNFACFLFKFEEDIFKPGDVLIDEQFGDFSIRIIERLEGNETYSVTFKGYILDKPPHTGFADLRGLTFRLMRYEDNQRLLYKRKKRS